MFRIKYIIRRHSIYHASTAKFRPISVAPFAKTRKAFLMRLCVPIGMMVNVLHLRGMGRIPRCRRRRSLEVIFLSKRRSKRVLVYIGRLNFRFRPIPRKRSTFTTIRVYRINSDIKPITWGRERCHGNLAPPPKFTPPPGTLTAC